MTTLNDIIGSIDTQLIQEEQAATASSTANTILGEQEQMRKYVLVRVGAEHMAIPIDGLAEIGPLPAVTFLPNLPVWITGIVNQRGEIISVVNLDLLLKSDLSSTQTGNRLAVLHNGAMKVGICIDQVIATVSKAESDRVVNIDCAFKQAEPDVFNESLIVDDIVYQILRPKAFLAMDRLMQYYSAE